MPQLHVRNSFENKRLITVSWFGLLGGVLKCHGLGYKSILERSRYPGYGPGTLPDTIKTRIATSCPLGHRSLTTVMMQRDPTRSDTVGRGDESAEYNFPCTISTLYRHYAHRHPFMERSKNRLPGVNRYAKRSYTVIKYWKTLITFSEKCLKMQSPFRL